MVYDYIKCPKLVSECQRIAESDVKTYIDYLEAQRYSHNTITGYLSSVIHYFSWRRKIDKNHPIDISDKHVRSFLSRHLKSCQCPSSFYRGRASCSASLRLWLRIIAEKDLAVAATKEDKLFEEYDEYLRSVAGLVKTSRKRPANPPSQTG